MKTRYWLMLGAAAAAAVMFSLWAERRDDKRVVAPVEEAEAPARAPARAPESAREQVSLEELATKFPGRAPRERRDAPVVNGVVQVGPKRVGKDVGPAPAAEGQTAAAWVTSYAVAMCECQTRSCAADLQGRFIHAMGGVDYDESRDGPTYHASVKRAVDCYFALPEGS